MQEAKCSDAQDRHTIEATILSWFETADLEVGSKNVQNLRISLVFSSGLIVTRYCWVTCHLQRLYWKLYTWILLLKHRLAISIGEIRYGTLSSEYHSRHSPFLGITIK